MAQLVTLTPNGNGCFTAPSGQELGGEALEFVRRLCLSNSLLWSKEPIILNCGQSSRHYANLRPEEDPDTLRLVGQNIARYIQRLELDPKKIPRLVGIPRAGTPLALAAFLNPCLGQILHYGLLREKLSDHAHGLDSTWAGPPDNNKIQFLVENVCTSGGSLGQYAKRLWSDGHDPESMHYIIGIDRGGAAALAKQGFKNLHVLLHMDDAMAAATYLGLREPWIYEDYLEEKETPLLI